MDTGAGTRLALNKLHNALKEFALDGPHRRNSQATGFPQVFGHDKTVWA